MNILKLIAAGIVIALFASGCYSIDEYYGSRRPTAILPLNSGISLCLNGIPLTN